jgi:hypothetical protein
VVYRLALGEAVPVSIIPPVFHTRITFIFAALAIDRVAQYNTSVSVSVCLSVSATDSATGKEEPQCFGVITGGWMSVINHSDYRDFLKRRQNRRKTKHTVLLFRKTMMNVFEILLLLLLSVGPR